MAGNRSRWRDRRPSLPAKRRRGRSHRRDVRRGAHYEPMPIHQAMARRGVASRLRLALAGMGVAVLCVAVALFWPQTQFALAALAALGFCALNLAVAALLSARREEAVHRLAHSMEERPLLEDSSGFDGNL